MDAERRAYIDEQIRLFYTKESNKILAERLGLSEVNLRKRASRLGIRKGTIANKIINGWKLCCICGKFKPVKAFRKDRCQPNHIDYRCKRCRKLKALGLIPDEPVIVQKRSGKWGFNHARTKNPVVNGKIKCRGFCKKWKWLDTDFSIDRKMSHGHVNYCKECQRKLRLLNKYFGVYWTGPEDLDQIPKELLEED